VLAGCSVALGLASASRTRRGRKRRHKAALGKDSQLVSQHEPRRQLLRKYLLGLVGVITPSATSNAVRADDKAVPPMALAVKGETLVPMSPSGWQNLLSKADVVLLGEHHNQEQDHELELSVVRMLHERALKEGRPFSVGLEMVQQRFQDVLDSYVAGKIDDDTLFKATEWERRWSWPYELYTPIFQYCQKQRVPIVALNTNNETLGKVERGGLEELAEQEWQQYIPDRQGFAEMGKTAEFKTYLQNVVLPSYGLHKRLGILQRTVTGQVLDSPMTLKHFVGGRILWDETMAGAAVRAMDARNGQRGQVCVLIGGDHVKYRYGVCARIDRLARLSNADAASPPTIASVMLNPTPADTLAPADQDGLALQMAVVSGQPRGTAQKNEDIKRQPIPLADLILISRFGSSSAA